MRPVVASLALSLAAFASAPLAAQAVVGTAVPPSTVPNSEPRPFRFATQASAQGTLVVPMSGTALPALSGVTLDEASRAAVTRAIGDAGFKGGKKETLALRGIGGWAQILLVGTGPLPQGEALRAALRDAGGRAAQALVSEKQPVVFAVPAGLGAAAQTAEFALGYALGQYRFDRYKSDRKAPPVDPVTFVSADAEAMGALWRDRLAAQAEAVTLSRDLATEPANVIYPESFVERTRAALAGVPGVSIEVLDEAAMRKLGMGSILGVGQGSTRPPRMMVVSYKGAGAPAAPLAIVGKGITFDSGGISLKPGAGMGRMKTDMSGAATAVATVLSLAKAKAPVNVVAVAALAENMPGGNAQRPGDVVRTMSGKTVEIISTDAEGRMVLADGIEYVIDRYKPAAVITIATLTGAAVRALDDEYTALFGRHDDLIEAIDAVGAPTGEAVWRLPLHDSYADDLRSPIADLKHGGDGPGASIGAWFVGSFVKEGTPWAHLDIAGTAWTDRGDAVTPKGATAWGVRLLDELARSWKP
ncbi:leucyl aminopeptidase [Sphingobium lignivorans]|uniref:Probable cytosol aminopeptidase n=1 Tax=Sphingobium lignivorans TaxID=2735886 RepID=A0ABR6NAE8_9SPHN|nr:leucyl aminopeptidase [Sphingobium lignivorans]